MPKYRHESTNADDGSPVAGIIEAPDEATARRLLQQRRLIAHDISKIRESMTVEELIAKTRPVPQEALVAFTRNLATMVDAGTSTVRAMQNLERQETNLKLRQTIRDIAESVEAGQSLSDAFGSHPDIFDRLYVAMVESGEVGGTLANSLDRLATQLEFAYTLKRKIKSAMVYPAVIFTVTIFAVLGLIVWMVPKFQTFYDSFDSKLPTITIMLTQFTDQLVPPDGKLLPLQAIAVLLPLMVAGLVGVMAARANVNAMVSSLIAFAIIVGGEAVVFMTRASVHGSVIPVPGGRAVATLARLGMLALLFALAGTTFKMLISTPGGRRVWDRFKLRAPLRFGRLNRKIAIARYASTMSTLLRSGTPSMQAYEIAAISVGNVVVEELLLDVRDAIESGQSMVGPMRESFIFEPMVIGMLETGEENGRVDDMLERIAERYDSDVRMQIETLQRMLEPLVLVVLGVCVGGVMIAMLMPIWSIWGQLSSQIG